METGRYKHYKNNYYEVLGVATHSETEEELVVYKDEKHGRLWVRPKAMFEEEVLVDGKMVKRFSKCDD